MKIGAVGFGNRIAHVYCELKEINKDARMIAFVDPTPIGKKGEIKPYSPVNIIGKIINADKSVIKNFKEGTKITFQKS